jgi:hypothetical protein
VAIFLPFFMDILWTILRAFVLGMPISRRGRFSDFRGICLKTTPLDVRSFVVWFRHPGRHKGSRFQFPYSIKIEFLCGATVP